MIVVNLDVMMAKRKISLNELSERVGITITNLSKLKTGKAKPYALQHLMLFARRWIVLQQIYWTIVAKSK